MLPKFPRYVSIDLASVRETRVNNLIRAEFETGPIQQRKLSARPLYGLQMKISFCKEDRERFDTWFNDEISSGSKYFELIHPVTGKKVRTRFVAGDLELEFVPYNIWQATVQLERWG